MLSELTQENKYCYIMGDININLLNYDTHQHTTNFVDLIHANSFVSLINKPTRVKQQSATLIDNIFTNSLSGMDHTIQGIIYSDISDHFPVIHIDYTFQAANVNSEIVRRNMSQRNKEAFCQAVSETGYPCIFLEMHKNHPPGFTQLYQRFLTSIFQNKLWIRNITLGKCD